MWEQSNFGDAIISAVLGQPIFQGAWSKQGDVKGVGQTNSTWNMAHAQLVLGRHHTWKGEMRSELKALSR